MIDLKVGDKILDLEATKFRGKQTEAVVTEVDGDTFLMDNKDLPQHYPHRFDSLTRGRKWKLK